MKKASTKFWLILFSVFIVGFILAKIDTSKNWDDTAITVGLVFASSFLFGILMPNFAWLWAIIIGVLIFSFNVIESHNYGSVGATIFAFVGAYSGVLFKKIITDVSSQ